MYSETALEARICASSENVVPDALTFLMGKHPAELPGQCPFRRQSRADRQLAAGDRLLDAGADPPEGWEAGIRRVT